MKKSAISLIISFNLLFLLPLQAQSLYCPKNMQYIKPGMTTAQVTQACGQPLSVQKSRGISSQRVPVSQYIYNSAGSRKAFYGQWQVQTGQGGAQVIVNVINNKVTSISMAGSSTNAFSLCDGNSVSVGDSVGKLSSACGTPSAVNNTYIEQPTGQSTQNEYWLYQINPGQPSARLTFVNGKLESIQ